MVGIVPNAVKRILEEFEVFRVFKSPIIDFGQLLIF